MEKINFENLPSTNTPINASNLNQLQTNVENAIEEKQTYSTTEQRIGTWINGKPLYRKVFYSTAKIEAVAEYKPNTTIANIGTVVDVNVIIGSAGSFCAKNYWSSGSYFISTQYDKTDGLYIEATYGGFVGWTLIVEYTKTTD